MHTFSSKRSSVELSALVASNYERLGVIKMGRMTKTQQRRLLDGIYGKASKLTFQEYGSMLMTTKDFLAIERIVAKYQKKLG